MNEPLTPLAEEAVRYREVFLAWVAGGFTEDQALRLIAYTLSSNIQQIAAETPTDEGDQR